MLEIYGGQWEREYGHVDGDAFPTWSDALSDMNAGQLRQGLDALELEGNDFPPNLIKFKRFCRNGNGAAHYHRPVKKALPKPAPRYSVMRIEQAKQRALTGQAWDTAEPRAKMVMDWDADDEEKLFELIATFKPIPGESPTDSYARINKLVDSVEFSHGSQWRNTH